QKCGLTKGIEAHRKVEFVLSVNLFLNTNCKYADIVLPATTQWERYGTLSGNRDHLIWFQKVTDPLFEAKDDNWIAVELLKRLGFEEAAETLTSVSDEQQMYNRLAGAWVISEDGKGREPLLTITKEDIEEMGVEGEPQQGRITLKEFREAGVYTVP